MQVEQTMFVVVVARTMAFFVDRSALMLAVLHLLLVGPMALPCRLNQLYDYTSSYYCDYLYRNSSTRYACRGGPSSRGFPCGAFCLYVYDAVSYTHWNFGAALSCIFFFNFNLHF